jgi:hypothetical protein
MASKSRAVTKVYQPEELKAYAKSHIVYSGFAKFSPAGFFITSIIAFVIALGKIDSLSDEAFFWIGGAGLLLAIFAVRALSSRHKQLQLYIDQLAKHPELIEEPKSAENAIPEDELERLGKDVVEVLRRAKGPLLFEEIRDACVFKDETAARVIAHLVKSRQIFEDVDLDTGDFVYVLQEQRSSIENMSIEERMKRLGKH